MVWIYISIFICMYASNCTQDSPLHLSRISSEFRRGGVEMREIFQRVFGTKRPQTLGVKIGEPLVVRSAHQGLSVDGEVVVGQAQPGEGLVGPSGSCGHQLLPELFQRSQPLIPKLRSVDLFQSLAELFGRGVISKD